MQNEKNQVISKGMVGINDEEELFQTKLTFSNYTTLLENYCGFASENLSDVYNTDKYIQRE